MLDAKIKFEFYLRLQQHMFEVAEAMVVLEILEEVLDEQEGGSQKSSDFHHFRMHYSCDCTDGGQRWDMAHSSACNDRCPNCNRETEPYRTENLVPPISKWDGRRVRYTPGIGLSEEKAMDSRVSDEAIDIMGSLVSVLEQTLESRDWALVKQSDALNRAKEFLGLDEDKVVPECGSCDGLGWYIDDSSEESLIEPFRVRRCQICEKFDDDQEAGRAAIGMLQWIPIGGEEERLMEMQHSRSGFGRI